MAARPRHHERGSVDQRPEELGYRHIEGVGSLSEEPVAGSDGIVFLAPEQTIHHSAVREHGALGTASGSQR